MRAGCLFLIIASIQLQNALGFRVKCEYQDECIDIDECSIKHASAGYPLGEDSPAMSRCSSQEDKYCCPPVQSNDTPPPPLKRPYSTTTSPKASRPEESEKYRQPDETTTEKTLQQPSKLDGLLASPESCGLPSNYTYEPRDITNKISGGKRSPRGSMPWMVMLFFGPENDPSKVNNYPTCGASLISDRYVLSAAHCFDKIKNGVLRKVRLGGHSAGERCRFIKKDIKQLFAGRLIAKNQCYVDIEPEEIISHPFADATKLKNDIALVRLKKQAPPGNKFINPVCMPFSHRTVELDETFYAAGWGATAPGQDVQDVEFVLRNVTIKGTGPCNMCTPESRISMCPLDDRTQLCIRSENDQKDVCKGDSGGPIMVKRGRHFVQVGVVSGKNSDCTVAGVPSIYTRIDGFQDWILENIRE